MESEDQWDWERLTQRVVEEGWRTYRGAVLDGSRADGGDLAEFRALIRLSDDAVGVL
jgi:hypothetical protein